MHDHRLGIVNLDIGNLGTDVYICIYMRRGLLVPRVGKYSNTYRHARTQS